MLNTWIGHLKGQLTQPDTRIYAIAKTSQNTDLDLAHELYGGEALIQVPGGSPDWTPHVYEIGELSPDNDLLERLINYGLGQMAVAFFSSRTTSLKSITKHLRRFTIVRDQTYSLYWMQFWDAVVAPNLFKHLNSDEMQVFFSLVDSITVEDYRKPENALTYSATDSPEPKDIDKPATWDKKGIWLMRPELQTALLRGYDDYRSYQLAKQLINEYPRGEDNLDEIEAWVQQQKVQIKQDNMDEEYCRNMIIAAWLITCEVGTLANHIQLDEKYKALNLLELSRVVFNTALKKQESK